ncbi:MAG TPA: hypothetical protein VM580_02545 [Labilithrix sp.]|nr:hypothetical protein [Labilithrix sp.]
MRCSALTAASLIALGASCAPSPRDVVPESRDVRGIFDAGGGDAYVYVARRPHGVVALAEARHMKEEDARALVDRLADDLERCSSTLESQGLLVEGAARIVAVAGPDGTPALNVRLSPGNEVAHNALVCIVAPVRAAMLPPPTANATPGIAIESTWGPARGGDGPTSPPDVDAGARL